MVSSPDSDPRPPAFRHIDHMVEATHFEYSRLCIEWRGHVQIDETREMGLPDRVEIGVFHGRPINITVIWTRINGHLVGFYDPCSELVDYKMIEEWLDQNFCPPREHNVVNRVDASNFRNCLVTLGIELKAFA